MEKPVQNNADNGSSNPPVNTQPNPQQQAQTQQATKPKKEIHISAATKDKAEAAKSYIERKYSIMIQEDKKNREVWQQIFSKMQ